MSEISDAVQIIRVAYDGVEIAMKVGSGSIALMQKAIDLIVGMLKYEKTMGKTNLKGMLQKGGDIQVLSFADEDFLFNCYKGKNGCLNLINIVADRFWTSIKF